MKASSSPWLHRNTADAALNALSAAPGGEDAQIIGKKFREHSRAARSSHQRALWWQQELWIWLVGDPLPRIC